MPEAVIGYVHPGMVRAEFCASLLGVARKPDGVRVDEFMAVVSSANISEARNLIVTRFLLESRAAWLLMADTDMVFAPDALDRLVAAADPAERPIVGAMCFSKDARGAVEPMLYKAVQDGTGCDVGFARYRSLPETGCMRVSATAAAFLLMHRDALEKIRAGAGDAAAPWFQETTLSGGLLGEDLTFCLRARDAGIPVHVCVDVQVGHMKSVMLGEVT